MMHCKRARRVFYHVLEGSSCLLADERDKKLFLDFLFSVAEKEGWLIYAFCITDSCAYFVMEAEGIGSVRRGIQQAANRFLDRYRKDLSHPGIRSAALRGETLETLDSLDEIAACCRQIHRIPLERGYVSRIGDYWWSSYITYIGVYDWEVVDCRVFSLCFSANPEIARHRLLEFHQKPYCEIQRPEGQIVMESE